MEHHDRYVFTHPLLNTSHQELHGNNAVYVIFMTDSFKNSI